ncbi:hypothetical protein BpHYR1_038107 [Brachionus plicatilis]|uniref:Uncharacterized protein n=1 Tax=Brachionus plicatilis TaxID=10195 RepID=A0A3M7Q3V8_BRAPC|nr:hypothetical protein BpHYR1_038107 [Brachionus plicatilis]
MFRLDEQLKISQFPAINSFPFIYTNLLTVLLSFNFYTRLNLKPFINSFSIKIIQNKRYFLLSVYAENFGHLFTDPNTKIINELNTCFDY